MSRVTVNGVDLNVEIAGEGPHVLLLHGFTGSVATWAPHQDAWRGFTTIAVDLLGHGDSDRPAETQRYALDPTLADLSSLLDVLGARHTAVLGYSMGGRIALHLALDMAARAPERLTALVLESTSPGIESAPEREARAASDAMLAAAIERDGTAAFVARWEALPLFATQALLPAATRAALRHQRLGNDPRGLAHSLRALSVGRHAPLHARLPGLRVPTLLLAGGLDDAYRRHAEWMGATLPRARVVVVPEAGHAVHLEQPEAFARTVRDFLEATIGGDTATTPPKEGMPCP